MQQRHENGKVRIRLRKKVAHGTADEVDRGRYGAQGSGWGELGRVTRGRLRMDPA